MKNNKLNISQFTFIFILFAMLFNACEDPIDVELKDADPQIVVDAWLINNDQQQEIKLTWTQPYFQNTFAEGIENANVVLRSPNGQSIDFTHTSNGTYIYQGTPNSTLGAVGDEFTLEIDIDGQQLSSTTQINAVPQIDSLQQEFRDDEVFLDDGIYCQFFSRDLPGLGDTYWIKAFKNDTFLNRAAEINIAYDAGFDSGGEVDNVVFITPIRELINAVDDDGLPVPWFAGDKLKVEIHSISNQAFAFMEIMRDQLNNSSNGIFAEPLANTKGNIVNNTSDEEILGIFNIAEVSSNEIIIQ